MEVEVTPGARKAGVMGRRGDRLKVRVHAPPREGRANKELVGVVAALWGVPKANVAVIRGAASRRKVLAIEGVDDEHHRAVLSSFPELGL